MNIASQRGRATHAILWTLVAVAAVVLIVALHGLRSAPDRFRRRQARALGDYHAGIPPGCRRNSNPRASSSAASTSRGRPTACLPHGQGGAPFAGGLAFVLPFGTMYSTNITPDVDTGIGSYTDAEFLDALHKA